MTREAKLTYGSLRVLAYLYDKQDYVPLLQISSEGKINYKTVRTAIPTLKELGLIEEKVEGGPPYRRLIKLTEKGRKAAEYAKKLLEVIEEL